MLGLPDGGLICGNFFRQALPLSRLRRALKQSHHPSPDWRKSFSVSFAGRGGNVAACWSLVQNSV